MLKQINRIAEYIMLGMFVGGVIALLINLQ